MRLPIYVLLFAAALVATAVSFRLSTTAATQSEIEFGTALSAGGAALWLLVTVGSFNILTVSGGSSITNSYPSLGGFAVICAGASILILGKGSLALMDT